MRAKAVDACKDSASGAAVGADGALRIDAERQGRLTITTNSRHLKPAQTAAEPERTGFQGVGSVPKESSRPRAGTLNQR